MTDFLTLPATSPALEDPRVDPFAVKSIETSEDDDGCARLGLMSGRYVEVRMTVQEADAAITAARRAANESRGTVTAEHRPFPHPQPSRRGW